MLLVHLDVATVYVLREVYELVCVHFPYFLKLTTKYMNMYGIYT